MESDLNNLEIVKSEIEMLTSNTADTNNTTKIEKTMNTSENNIVIVSSDSIEAAKKNAESQRALEKLDKLLQANSITKKKIIKSENGEKSSNVSSIVTLKTAPVKKEAPRILNASLAKSPNLDNKRLLNNIGKSVMSEKDLIAILEGNNQDEEGEVDVKIIEDSAGKKKTMTTVLLSKNQELRIAADQIKEISRKSGPKPGPVPNTGNNANSGSTIEMPYEVNELVSSIASEWSDNERENSDNKSETNELITVKQVVKKRKAEPKLPTLKDKEEENENEEIPEVKEETVQTPVQPTGIAPFKRSRVIKKKIIWDPDAPETQFSYASLIKPKVKPNTNKKSVQKETLNESPIKLETNIEPKKTVVEKSKPATNRKRKEASPDSKIQQNIEDALNEILADEIISAVGENSENSAPPPPKQKEPVQAKKPRMTKGKQNMAQPSSSWDYVNKGRSDEMMIIRRRSSSYSSTTSQRRQSLEQQTKTPPQKSIRVVRKVSGAETLKTSQAKAKKQEIQLKKVNATNQENSVKPMPVVKKLSALETKKLVPPSPAPQIAVTKKASRQTPTADLEKTSIPATNPTSTNIKVVKVEKKEEKSKLDFEITLKKLDSVVNLIMDIKTENPANTFSIDFIKKLKSILEQLSKDGSCKVVVVTSKGTHFCHGIDFSCLLASTIEKRKTVAIELAKNVKLLFETLINFNKPLIAAIGGVLTNLGVTILPLFDVVFASDKCAFEMTYSKIGQIPEGNCILSTINMDKKYKMKLIYLAEKLTANEALSAGLITAIYPTQRLETEALNVATKMASLSQQTYKGLKELSMQRFVTDDIVKMLEEEQKLLIDNWISAECQEKFKELLQK